MESHEHIVSTAQLAQHLDDPDWLVVDCRFRLPQPAAGIAAYVEAHIPGAYYAHLDDDLAGPSGDGLGRHPLPELDTVARLGAAWGLRPGRQVVAYDDAAGAIAARLWWLLRWLGHRAVAVLDGGWPQWVAERRPLSAAVPPAHPGACFTPRPAAAAWLSTRQVQDGLARGAIVLVDAREPARFRGEHEPIDPVAGHIPGALNRPFQANLTATGHWAAPAALRTRWAPLAAAGDARAIVHMCGSGVTACHNVLAMEMAGLSGSRLYVGSWSEWLRDPDRPVARGE